MESSAGLSKINKATRCRFGAQTVLIVLSNKDEANYKDNYSTYEMDSTIVATHMMLKTTNIGIDNIWIKLYDSDILKSITNFSSSIW